MRTFSTKRRQLFTAILLAVTAIVGASAAVMFQNQERNGANRQAEDQPTVIKDGLMTERQRQHGKLFKHSGAKFQDLAKRQAGDIEIEEGLGLTTTLQPGGARRPIFESAVCNADAVFVGSITSKVSQLTEEQNYIFTDYEITVEDVIKNNVRAPVQVNTTINSTREGGVIELNGRVFRVKREDFDPTLIGQRYLMFLHFIPATGAYLMYGNGTFQLTDHNVMALGPGARAEISKTTGDPTSFLDRIRTFAKSDCSANQ